MVFAGACVLGFFVWLPGCLSDCRFACLRVVVFLCVRVFVGSCHSLSIAWFDFVCTGGAFCVLMVSQFACVFRVVCLADFLSARLNVCVFVCLYHFVPVCVRPALHVGLLSCPPCMCVGMFGIMYVCVFVCLPDCLHAFMFALYVCMPVCEPVCLYLCWHVCCLLFFKCAPGLSACLLVVYMSVCLYVSIIHCLDLCSLSGCLSDCLAACVYF